MTKCALAGCTYEVAVVTVWGAAGEEEVPQFRALTAEGWKYYCSERHWEQDRTHASSPSPTSDNRRVAA